MRVFFIRKAYLAVAACLAAAVGIYCLAGMPAAIEASVATRQLPIYCVDRADNVISISFDAAWGNVLLW